MNKLESEVIQLLEKYESREDNIKGIMSTLQRDTNYTNALLKFYMYLQDKSTDKNRDSLIRQAYKIIGIELPTFDD